MFPPGLISNHVGDRSARIVLSSKGAMCTVAVSTPVVCVRIIFRCVYCAHMHHELPK